MEISASGSGNSPQVGVTFEKRVLVSTWVEKEDRGDVVPVGSISSPCESPMRRSILGEGVEVLRPRRSFSRRRFFALDVCRSGEEVLAVGEGEVLELLLSVLSM